MTIKLAAACIIVLLAACAKPTIDASTDEAMKASVAKVRESLPEGKRDEFDKAVELVALSQLDFKTLMTDGATGANTTVGRMKSSLNGKTGAEVIAEGKRIEEERKAKERVQALAEIKELQEKKSSAESAKVELAKFQVIRSRFYKQKREYLGEQPIIELSVRNGTGHPVSRAYFAGTLASPSRSVPWMKDTFNYSISGGLEPGEEASWSLAPNMFSDWGKVEAPADAVLTVEVEKLDGADGNTLFSTRDFTDRDEDRLKRLMAEYAASAVTK